MGASSGGKNKFINFRNKQRANMSFFIVVMFFAVFGIIVFTEVFFINEKEKNAGVAVRNGIIHYSQDKTKNDYNDFQNDDYISLRLGQILMDHPDLDALIIGKTRDHISNLNIAQPFELQIYSEKQFSPYPENYSLTNGSWQNVNGSQYKFFVFSAYYDNRRNQRNVRIIAATKTRGPEKVWCKLWYRNSDGNSTINISKTVQARIKIIRENWNLRYSACFVMCPLEPNQSIPLAVSVIARPKTAPMNMLNVINNFNENADLKTTLSPSNEIPIGKFGVCVKPLHFDYNKEIELIEFIEFNRLLGVDHFTFYNHTIGPQVSCILHDYQDNGIVTLLPWHLAMLSQKEIRTEGLFAALNDCLYRSMYKYSHILLIDLDEYIIPKYNETLPQLIESLSHRLNTRTTASFSFQNAFFYLQWDDDDQVYDFKNPISSNLITMRKTRRKTKLHPHKQRSKYICKPELVVEAGNHFVWEFISGHGTMNVPADAAILHHYRICEFGGNDCIKTVSTVDKTAYKYLDKLTNAVEEKYEQLKSKCNLNKPKEQPKKMIHKIFSMLKT